MNNANNKAKTLAASLLELGEAGLIMLGMSTAAHSYKVK